MSIVDRYHCVGGSMYLRASAPEGAVLFVFASDYDALQAEVERLTKSRDQWKDIVQSKSNNYAQMCEEMDKAANNVCVHIPLEEWNTYQLERDRLAARVGRLKEVIAVMRANIRHPGLNTNRRLIELADEWYSVAFPTPGEVKP